MRPRLKLPLQVPVRGTAAIDMAPRWLPALVERRDQTPLPEPRRARIWELTRYLHCSVIGTCLTTAELRQVLARSAIEVAGASEHDVHKIGVGLAGQSGAAGKLLNKALDRRHRRAVNAYSGARNEAEVAALWDDHARRGEIPGAYWAALTHPHATDTLVRRIFGEVHMLSHLVGAANRADIVRLNALEAEIANLKDKLTRQERHLRDGLSERDRRISDLNELLTRQIARAAHMSDTPQGSAERSTLSALVSDLERRLGVETRRREAMEARIARLTRDRDVERDARQLADSRACLLADELDVLERAVADGTNTPPVSAPVARPAGLTVLYVGGRPGQHEHLRAVATRRGFDLLIHDGGIEERHGLLIGLVRRADLVAFPTDCVSHEAVVAIKRLCRKVEKPYLPLRSSGVSSLLAALDRFSTSAANEPDMAST